MSALGWGDDARLARASVTDGLDARCPGLHADEGVFAFGATDDELSRAAVADDFSCVARMGTGGCGFEQPLEAALRALAPSAPTTWTAPGYVPITFRDGSFGHGLDANAGFVREDSVLAITLLSDEEDCSTPDTGLFVTGDPRFASVPLNLRCSATEPLLYATNRYVAGLASLRRDPRLLVFSAITGVPPGTYVDRAAYDALLLDPDMQARHDAARTSFVDVCESMHGTAEPARRTVRVARDLERAGAMTSVSSICARSYESAVSDIVHALARSRSSC